VIVATRNISTMGRSSTPAKSEITPEGRDAPRAIEHQHPVERRRHRQHDQSPATILKQLPALVVLDRIPVPVLAIAEDGSILFTNTAFAAMVGFEPDEVLSLRFDQIFHWVPVSEPPLSAVCALANMVVELRHKDGSTVRALMTRSALTGPDDQFALAVFQDLTQRLWEQDWVITRGQDVDPESDDQHRRS
jgi:PAS domain S-box-containing protein